VWVELALASGFLQTTRNALSRSLAGTLSPALISWARFAFALPFAALAVLALTVRGGGAVLTAPFLALCLATALSQLLGNVALIAAFRRANFAESILLHKLEVVLTALVGALLFTELPTALGWLGVVACGLGVMAINLGRSRGPSGWRRAFHLDAGAWLALGCAALLVLASFALKEANEQFAMANPRVGDGRFEAAAQTLFHTLWMEVGMLTAYLVWRRDGELRKVRRHWQRMAWIGAAGFGASLGWFWAFSLTLVAYVKAVGQVEALLAVALALVVWREPDVRRQLPGVALVVVGIALVLLG
jgi:drug/metabolite transporter (DMT)-like permease